MKFEDVMPALRRGEKVRRASWDKGRLSVRLGLFDGKDVLADDWEVVEEPLTYIELAERWEKLSVDEHDHGVHKTYLRCAHELRKLGVKP